MGDWKDSLVLEKDEIIVNSWEGSHQWVDGKWYAAQGLVSWDDKKHDKGILVLTTRKLIFLHEKGTFRKSYHASFTIPIEKISSISMGGTIRKYVSLFLLNQKEAIFHLSDVKDDITLSQFREVVNKQITARKEAIQAEKVKDRTQIILDFSFLKEYMSNYPQLVSPNAEA